MNFRNEMSAEAQARLLELLKQSESTQQEIFSLAERETERINGAHKEASLTELRYWRASVLQYGTQPQYENLCAIINDYGVEPAIEPARPVGWLQKLLTFLGLDLWIRRAKQN